MTKCTPTYNTRELIRSRRGVGILLMKHLTPIPGTHICVATILHPTYSLQTPHLSYTMLGAYGGFYREVFLVQCKEHKFVGRFKLCHSP